MRSDFQFPLSHENHNLLIYLSLILPHFLQTWLIRDPFDRWINNHRLSSYLESTLRLCTYKKKKEKILPIPIIHDENLSARERPIINYQTQDGREAARRLIRARIERAVAVVKRGVRKKEHERASFAPRRVGSRGRRASPPLPRRTTSEGGRPSSRGDRSERPQWLMA